MHILINGIGRDFYAILCIPLTPARYYYAARWCIGVQPVAYLRIQGCTSPTTISLLGLELERSMQAAVSAVRTAMLQRVVWNKRESERRLPGEKQIGSAIWPNDRFAAAAGRNCFYWLMRVHCKWCEYRAAHNTHTRGGGHILFKLVRGAPLLVCVCLGGTAGRTGANECTARFQGCICLNPPTHILRRQPIWISSWRSRAARKINRRAWNNNKERESERN